jgi:hypothetical protein
MGHVLRQLAAGREHGGWGRSVALLPDIIRHGIRVRLAGALGDSFDLRRQLPTSSIYFSDPLSGYIGTRLDGYDRPIRRISNTVFICDDTAVVIRYAGPRVLSKLERRPFRRIYLLVDDDFQALCENDGLPADYRKRLLTYRDGLMQRLPELVTHVVAPSELILKGYRKKRGIYLDPAQCHTAGGLAHHRRGKGLDVVFAGSRSHLHDFDFIAGALAEFFEARPDAHLTTFLNGHAPRVLRQLPNSKHLGAMDWDQYRSFVAENRFHVAVAPALDTDFNKARSVSRLHDHAAYGAAGVYSRQPPFSGIVAHGRSGLLLANNPNRWRDCLFDLAERRDMAETLAAEGQHLSLRLGDRRRVRNFWLSELGLRS